MEKNAEDKLTTRYIRESKHNSRQTDLFLSNSTAMSCLVRDAFWYNGEILECGSPRNDILLSNSETEINRIKASLGVNCDTKLVLYAPTFRDDGSVCAYDINCGMILEKLRSRGADWRILTRLHPNVSAAKNPFPQNEYIINATPYPDIQELLLAADILITDYSSTPFEFAVMGKQVYIYASDLAEYQALRGLSKDFFTTPYPMSTTNEDLLKHIALYSPESAKQQAADFMTRFGGADKGNAAKTVVEWMKQIVLRN